MAKQSQSTSDTPSVSVEYDYGTKGERHTKEFVDASQAENFLAGKEKGGKNPSLLTATERNGTDTTRSTDATTKAERLGSTKKPPGVRAMRTRPYLAGVIIAKHGLAKKRCGEEKVSGLFSGPSSWSQGGFEVESAGCRLPPGLVSVG